MAEALSLGDMLACTKRVRVRSPPDRLHKGEMVGESSVRNPICICHLGALMTEVMDGFL